LARRSVVVTLPEQTDFSNAARVAEQLTSAVSRHSTVIIDMSATTFCDCAGGHAIVGAFKHCADSGAEVRLVVAAEIVRRILNLMEVDRLVDFYPSVEAARGNRGAHVRAGR
jgi:anti-anti-sigma factor